LISDGVIQQDGPAPEVTSTYLLSSFSISSEREWPAREAAAGDDIVRLRRVRVRTEDGATAKAVDIRRPVGLEMVYDVLQPVHVLIPFYEVHNEAALCLFISQDLDPAWRGRVRPVGRYTSVAWIPGNFLAEGALLVIDAAQGVEAQTLANYHLALEHGLTIIPVINKIDLPAADPELVRKEIEELLIMEGSEAILASAKEGIGIDEILEAIVTRIPPPKSRSDLLRGLVFNAQFDPYRGVVVYVRVSDGTLKAGTRIMSMAQKKVYEVAEVGVFKPEMRRTDVLEMGGVGYVIANIKSLGDMDVGDTITEASNPATEALPGYKPIVPMVYCGLYPNEGVEVSELRDALDFACLVASITCTRAGADPPRRAELGSR